MDLKPKILHAFPASAPTGNGIPAGNQFPVPFYMTYPGYLGGQQESAVLRDLEYLQQAYPKEVKRYQRRVAQILDKMDYEGSMIYDEYPDYYSLRRMTESMLKILQNEDRELPEEQRISAEKWNWLADMIHVLLCDEVYKRRHGGRRGSISWMS